jgi:uncharacterized protein YpuA (DUF1002 family)
MKIKHYLKVSVLFMLIIGLVTSLAITTQADSKDDDSDSINEKFGLPVVVYGDKLSEAQRQEVRDLLKVKDVNTIKEVTVTAQDNANYIGGSPDSNMYSSARIVLEDSGKGITINIVTPNNITEVSSDMYANALITAGVEDATVDVVSPIKVSGHSALAGIYKVYDVEGVELDKERMELADEELGLATDLAEKEGMSQEKVSELLTEIKKAIADQNPATKEDVERIVKEQLEKLEISLSEADRELLINLFEKMRDLNIDFGKVKNQLEDIASTIKDKVDDLGLDAGFWEKVANFFKNLFNKIASLFE